MPLSTQEILILELAHSLAPSRVKNQKKLDFSKQTVSNALTPISNLMKILMHTSENMLILLTSTKIIFFVSQINMKIINFSWTISSKSSQWNWKAVHVDRSNMTGDDPVSRDRGRKRSKRSNEYQTKVSTCENPSFLFKHCRFYTFHSFLINI